MESPQHPGRTYIWTGAALALSAPLLFLIQFAVLRKLETPWYLPAIAAVGAVAVGLAMARRRTWKRALLFLVILIECFGSAAILASAELEPYTGPAQVGETIPAFQARLASTGDVLTEEDLTSGMQVLVFYRGHL